MWAEFLVTAMLAVVAIQAPIGAFAQQPPFPVGIPPTPFEPPAIPIPEPVEFPSTLLHTSAYYYAQRLMTEVSYTVIPWDGGTPEEGMVQAQSGFTIPMFNYSFKASKDGKTYSGIMAGSDPFDPASGSSGIRVVVVPLEITFSGSQSLGSNGRPISFNPIAQNPCNNYRAVDADFMFGPLANNVLNLTINGVNIGNVQWSNGFRRAEFWNVIASDYQLQLAFRESQVHNVNPGIHGVGIFDSCFSGLGFNFRYTPYIGFVSLQWLDNTLRASLIPALQKAGLFSPTQFVIFLMRNIMMTDGDPSAGRCCTLGYHSATGNPAQTFAVVDWDEWGLTINGASGFKDAAVSSHEIGEWMDDPLGTNTTPSWGNIGQQRGCLNPGLEVGDPLSDGHTQPSIIMNNTTYHVQELAFFSWFFNKLGVPSLGAGGKFSSNGTFHGPAKPCPPGGTY
jgi:hypothetical protein